MMQNMMSGMMLEAEMKRLAALTLATVFSLSSAFAETGDAARGEHDLEPAKRVKTITYCHETYRVTTADGKTRAFWERNLRFMTDSGQDGPEKGAPAIMPAGMMGDRASVIFAAPEEFNRMIEAKC